MKTLYLLRHAKSAWNDPSLDDHDRPLAPRGARAATLIGRHLRGEGFHPDVILCSTARRAVDTLALVTAQLGTGQATAEYDHGLYLSGERALLDRLRRLPEGAATVLLVAHNPDLHNLAQDLAGNGDASLLRGLAGKFPTAALAVLTFAQGSWSDIGSRAGTLSNFVLPKKLT